MKIGGILKQVQANRDEQLAGFLTRVNRNATPYPRTETVSRVFLQVATQSPEALALVYLDNSVSYSQLAGSVGRIAAALTGLELPAETIIGLLAAPCSDAIAAMLGILASGGAYMPLTPDSPPERLIQQLHDSKCAVLLVDSTLLPLALELQNRSPHLLHIRGLSSLLDPTLPTSPVVDRSRPDGLAYVMYTSGTEGQPKGVMVEHRAILRLVLQTSWIDLSPKDRIVLTSSLSFDASTFELWGALLNGGALIIPERDQLLAPASLTHLIRAYDVTTAWFTAGLFHTLAANHLEVFRSLRTVISGGDKVSAHHFRVVLKHFPSISLRNGYGPTENTTFTTVHDFADDGGNSVPIGKPISNTTVFVLDAALRPVDIGIPGDLYTGGDGLARGYLNDPVLTAERFIVHPSFGRLYRTGDRAAWRADGTLDFLGRSDNQFKLRGYRIEPAEIENTLIQHPALKECILVPARAESGDVALHLYYTASAAVPPSDLKAFANTHLPEWMVPSSLLQLDSIPLTANGKPDLRALPPITMANTTHAADDHLSQTESLLLEIWQEVLERGPIGVHDNYFALGGHSLRSMRLIHLVQQRLAFTLSFTALYKYPTIRTLGDYIVEQSRFGSSATDDLLVCLTPLEGGPAVFALPPGTADAISYGALATALTGVRFYAFNFLAEADPIAACASAILETHPQGALQLFGYSGGGNLAYRTAVQLEAWGHTVAHVVMLDSSRFLVPYRLPAEEPRRLATNFLASEAVLAHASSVALQDKVTRRIEGYYASLSSQADNQPIDAPIDLITCADSVDQFHDDSGNLVCSKSSWEGVTRTRFRKFAGYGDHGRMLHNPFLDQNLTLIRSCFADLPAANVERSAC